MTTPLLPDTGAPFAVLAGQLASHPWRSGLAVQPMASPHRVASESAAIEARVVHDDEDVATGRLVLLHEPQGREAWQGTLRLVSFCRADITADDATDPAFPAAAWAWLTGSLAAAGARHAVLSGTVTTVTNRGFGELVDDPSLVEVELRASWTPVLHPHEGLERHLAAWQDLLCRAAGTPDLPEGVVPLGTRMGRGR